MSLSVRGESDNKSRWRFGDGIDKVNLVDIMNRDAVGGGLWLSWDE